MPQTTILEDRDDEGNFVLGISCIATNPNKHQAARSLVHDVTTALVRHGIGTDEILAAVGTAENELMTKPGLIR